jgi:hypothetical protein
MLYNTLLLLDATRRRLHEKSVVIENLRDNLRTERNATANRILVQKLEREAERRKGKDKNKTPRERDAQLHMLEGGSGQAQESVQGQFGTDCRRM